MEIHARRVKVVASVNETENSGSKRVKPFIVTVIDLSPILLRDPRHVAQALQSVEGEMHSFEKAIEVCLDVHNLLFRLLADRE